MEQAQAEFVARYVDYQFIDRFGHALTDYRPPLDRRDGVGEEDGLVRVYDAMGLVGYADRGTIVIEPRFKEGDEFSEGLAGVQINGKWGFINRAGDVVIPPKWLWVDHFSGGLAAVGSASGLGYIDKQGRYVWGPTK